MPCHQRRPGVHDYGGSSRNGWWFDSPKPRPPNLSDCNEQSPSRIVVRLSKFWGWRPLALFFVRLLREGQIAGDLDRVGRPIGRCDPMIAAIALTHGLELATGNTSHYQRTQQFGYPLILVNRRQ